MSVIAAFTLVVATALIVTACTGGGGDRSSRSDEPTVDAPTSDAAPILGEGQTLHAVGVVFQYGAFEVTVGDVVYDHDSKDLLVGVRFRNLGDAWTAPYPPAALEVAGTELPVEAEVMTIPPRMSADLTWKVGPLAEDPVPDGVLKIGDPSFDQPIVHLDGSGENLWRPVDVAVEGWAGIGKYTVHVTAGRVLAGSPAAPGPADKGTRILRLVFDTFTHRIDAVNGFYPVEHLTLRRPDGTTVEGVGSSDGFAPASWTAVAANFIDFPILTDSIAGTYELALSSLSPNGFSTLHPELIERVTMPFTLAEPTPVGTKLEGRGPMPALERDSEDASLDRPVTLALSGPELNVGGFLYQANEMRWDPASQTAELEGEVEWIEAATAADADDLAGGFLDVPPEFAFNSALVSEGRFYTGVVKGTTFVDPVEPTPITIEFLGVSALDPADLGLVIGPAMGAPSSMPLTDESPVALYPPPPVVNTVEGAAATAGDWTVTVDGYRVGFLESTNGPRPGTLELELFFSATAAPNAHIGALGLSFQPSAQLFLAHADGYMQQPKGDSGLVSYEPGDTKRQSVVFQVSDIFDPGPLSLVLRSDDELTDVFDGQFVETTFGVTLTDAANTESTGL